MTGFPKALEVDPEDLRASLLTLLLRVALAVGVVVYLPSAYYASTHGLYLVIVVDTIVVAAIAGLLFARRVAFLWRAACFCLICYLLGIGLLLTVGSVSQIYLFGFSVLAVLLLGLRAGLVAVVLSSISLLAIGWLGHEAPEMAIPTQGHDFSSWMLITLNFTLVNTVLTLAIGAVLAAMHRASARGRAIRASLDGEIAERKLAEAERDRLLAQLQLQIERMPLAYLLTDRDLRYTRWNPSAERMFGFAEADVLGKHPFDVIVPPTSQALVGGIFDRLAAGSMDEHGESENRTKDGRTIVCEWQNIPIADEAGVFVGLLSLAQDITDRKQLEGQLRHAQKMEAVGQLAGGVAHDFNNLLSVILSYADLVLADLGTKDALRHDVDEIRRAGTRAAVLTRQLLMFSRQQVVQPRVLDLNELVAGIDKMLHLLVGEGIELAMVPGAALGRIRADAGSVEQVVVNLVVNARDAMPAGGKLAIETANVTLDADYARTHLDARPGSYVMISVTDTGTGIDPATMARIFEPFFTTKEKGKGTGLGLSTVLGIVQQSGGTVWLDSTPGVGTTFKIYLPRVDATADVALAPVAEATRRGAETILIVEDEDQVREVAQGILRRHGYRVFAARSAGEGLLLCEQHDGPIHLLLSDVVMPQMTGPVLARRLAPLRPEMKVLFMSGYTDDAAVRHGVIATEVEYLQKPLSVANLTRKVREVLDAAPRASHRG